MVLLDVAQVGRHVKGLLAVMKAEDTRAAQVVPTVAAVCLGTVALALDVSDDIT